MPVSGKIVDFSPSKIIERLCQLKWCHPLWKPPARCISTCNLRRQQKEHLPAVRKKVSLELYLTSQIDSSFDFVIASLTKE